MKTRKHKVLRRTCRTALMALLVWAMLFTVSIAKSVKTVTELGGSAEYFSKVYAVYTNTNTGATGDAVFSENGTSLVLKSQSSHTTEECNGGWKHTYSENETTVYFVAKQDVVVRYATESGESDITYPSGSSSTVTPSSRAEVTSNIPTGTMVPAGGVFWFKLTSREGYFESKNQNEGPSFLESETITFSFETVDLGLTEGNAVYYVPGDVSGIYYYDYLDRATAAAQNTTLKRVIVSADGYARNSDGSDVLTVPAGVELTIPYETYDEGFFGPEPNNYLGQADAYAAIGSKGTGKVAYAAKVLTVESGKCMEVYGSLNVNGQRQNDGQPMPGVVLGGYGKLVLGAENTGAPVTDESSMQTQLLIKSGGKLYAYGYITGTGLVDVENGGTVHELLQLACWPGGGNANNWRGIGTTSRDLLFIVTQYYIQNIEAPVRVHHGATLNAEAVFAMSGVTYYKSVPYVTTSDADKPGMFLLSDSNAYLLRVYDVKNDRMNYFLKGGAAQISYMEIQLAGQSMNSSNYILPINHSMTVSIESGASVSSKYKLALLPGAELIVQEGATAELSNEVYIFDVNDYTSEHFFNRGGSVSDNKTPNHCPVPYVATLNSHSPNSTKLVRFDSSNKRYYPVVKNITKSAVVRVDGTLNITGNGALLTTNDGSTEDKAITGSGMIVYNGTPVDKDMRVGYAGSGDLKTVHATYGLANIASVGTLMPIAKDTYYGLGDYWYNYLVTVNTPDNLAKFTMNTLPTLSSSTVTRDGEDVVNVLGAVGYYLKDGNKTLGTVSFTMDADPTLVAAASNGTLAAALSADGTKVTYTLSDISSDVVLSTAEAEPTTVKVVASNASGAVFREYEVALFAGTDLSAVYSDVDCKTPATAENIGGTVYTPMEAVAAIGPEAENYVQAFLKVSEAVAAASDSNTYVTVLQNRTLTDPIVVANDKDITLDLGGKTLTGKVATVFNSEKSKKLVTNNGTMRLLNGKITFNGVHTAASDYTDANFAATVYNLGTIEYIENVTLEETGANIYVAALLNGNGGTIKEIRSGTLKGKDYATGTAILNRGTINTIGTSDGKVEIIGRRGIALWENGRIDTIGGEGSTIVLESSQRGINTHAPTASIGTIGENGSTVNITMKTSGMGRTAIYGESSGVIEVIGGKGSTLNITVEEGAIYTQTAINVTKAPSGGAVIIGDVDSIINITVVNNVTVANANATTEVYSVNGIKNSTTAKIGEPGSAININVNQKGKGTAYGIYNSGTIKSLGAADASIEIVSNYDGIYNDENKTISAISGDVVVISTDETGSYYGLHNLGTIGVINSGDYYHASGRENAVYNPDSQKYPSARHGLSSVTRAVDVNGTPYNCYYVCVLDPIAETVTGETTPGSGDRVGHASLSDAIAAYCAMETEEKKNTYILLSEPVTETQDITLEEDIYLNLNGFAVNLDSYSIDLNGHNLYVIDSGTNAYLMNQGDEAGSIVGTVRNSKNTGAVSAVHTADRGANQGKTYVQTSRDNGLEFHRVAVHVTGIQLAVAPSANEGYLTFRGTFRGDTLVADKLEDVGFMFSDADGVSTGSTWFSAPTTGEEKEGEITKIDKAHFYYTKQLTDGTIKDIAKVAAQMRLDDSDTPYPSKTVDVKDQLEQLQEQLSKPEEWTEDQMKAFTDYLNALIK